MRRVLKTISLALASAVMLTACGGEKQAEIIDVINSVGKWHITKDIAHKYAKYDTNGARQRYLRDKFAEESKLLATDLEKKRLAAALYMNFYMLQHQAIKDYCAGMNVDVSAFRAAMHKVNSREHGYVTQILAADGTSYDSIVAHFGPKLKSAAKYELMSTGSSHSACTKLKKEPQKYGGLMKFAAYIPSIASALVIRS